MEFNPLGLAFAAVAALSNCAGGLIATGRRTSNPVRLRGYMAFGAGFILTAAVTEMVPESLSADGVGATYAPLLILGGYLLVLLCENALVSHMHIEDPLHREEMVRSFVGTAALIGMTIHATLDGAMISSGFSVRNELGILLFLIAVVHKVPEGLTISSIQLASGHSRKSAFGSAVLLGVSTLVGAGIVSVFAGMAPIALPVATGAILYVAMSDLIPVLGERKSVGTVGVIALGGGVFLLTHLLLHMMGMG
jgi:ZIP family zinc transporter/zinc and cadmium transporter